MSTGQELMWPDAYGGEMHYLYLALVVACVIGAFKPFIRDSRRLHYVIAGILSFTLLASTMSPAPAAPEQIKDDEGAAQTSIEAKAKEAISAIQTYDKKEDPDVYKAVGPKLFAQVGAIEHGAVYAAAESNNCDSAEVSAVLTEKSSKDGVAWFVDCKNGNRFIISQTQAAAALAREKAGKLAASDLGASCTAQTVGMCLASPAQKQAKDKEAEIVSACDMAVKNALIGDSSMDWTWNVGIGKGDNLEVVRGFKAENAFGANLKHRYFCTYDAGTQQIVKLIIDGPMGSKQII